MKSIVLFFIVLFSQLMLFGQTNNNGFGHSIFCQTNINCSEVPLGNAVNKRSVVLILKPYLEDAPIRQATGILINNSKNDYHPYLLTAAHILDGREAEWQFLFGYESPNCNNIDGDSTQLITGATVLAEGDKLLCDFALLELHGRPLADFKPYFAGWDISNIKPDFLEIIHHPRGDIKKYAVANNVKEEFPIPDKSWVINQWEYGRPEFVSSGAPLFNSTYVVAIQSNINSISDCESDTESNVVKFYKAWKWGDLSSWLSPSGSTLTKLRGSDPCRPYYEFENVDNLHNYHFGGYYSGSGYISATNTTIQSGTSVTFEAAGQIIINNGFKIENGATFKAAIIDDCRSDCMPIEVDMFPNIITPDGNGVNDELCYTVQNATSYSIEVYNIWNQLVYNNSAAIANENVCTWDASGLPADTYYVTIRFTSSCDMYENTYPVTVIK